MVTCSICLDTIKTPTCCVPCGHMFCNRCIQRWQRQSAINFTARDCPQCRCRIENTQIIMFDTAEEVGEIEYTDTGEDPWDDSDVGKIVTSLENIWKRSHVRRIIKAAQVRALSYDCVKHAWYSTKDGWNIGRQFVNEVQELNGIDNKVNHVKLRLHQSADYCHHKLRHHPFTVSMKRRWEEMSDDWRLVLAISLALFVVLLLVDIQHKEGLIQSVIFPVFQTISFISQEFLTCLAYIVFRPLYCSCLCTMEVATTIADVTVETLISLFQMLIAVGVLPLTMILGLIQVVMVTVGTLLRTMIPLFILVYILSPSVQHHCRTILARLQQQNQAD